LPRRSSANCPRACIRSPLSFDACRRKPQLLLSATAYMQRLQVLARRGMPLGNPCGSLSPKGLRSRSRRRTTRATTTRDTTVPIMHMHTRALTRTRTRKSGATSPVGAAAARSISAATVRILNSAQTCLPRPYGLGAPSERQARPPQAVAGPTLRSARFFSANRFR